MANALWHRGYGIEVDLTREDLGHPDRPDLPREICTAVADRDPRLLECLAHHDGHECGAREGGKSPWMFVSRRRRGGAVRLIASHLPVTHRATAAESDRHKATKERIAIAAERGGLEVVLEARARDGRGVSDALVTAPDGTSIGWEIQYHHLGPGSVRRRSERIRERRVTPAWVTDNRAAALIDRAPWTRIDHMPWKDIADGRELVIRGGVRGLHVWTCTRRSDFHCPDRPGHCGKTHTDWRLPVDCVPRRPLVTIDDLVVGSAHRRYVPVVIPTRRDPRVGRHMWVSPDEYAAWQDIAGTPPGQPDKAEETEETEEVRWSGEGPDRSCTWGREGRFAPTDARPVRDTGETDTRRRPQPPAGSWRGHGLELTAPERRAAALAFGCAAWEIGPCTGCGGVIDRYRRNAGIYCHECRNAPAPTR